MHPSFKAQKLVSHQKENFNDFGSKNEHGRGGCVSPGDESSNAFAMTTLPVPGFQPPLASNVSVFLVLSPHFAL
jgi:hypothetical protein